MVFFWITLVAVALMLIVVTGLVVLGLRDRHRAGPRLNLEGPAGGARAGRPEARRRTRQVVRLGRIRGTS